MTDTAIGTKITFIIIITPTAMFFHCSSAETRPFVFVVCVMRATCASWLTT